MHCSPLGVGLMAVALFGYVCVAHADSPISKSGHTSANASAKQRKDLKPERRKLTRTECARMERQLPSLAYALGMEYKGFIEAEREAKADPYPEAAMAMLSWIATYNQESHIRYPYELARAFGDECRRGRITVN